MQNKSIDQSSTKLSHINEDGQIQMVDVGNKAASDRLAIAQCEVQLNSKTWKLLSAQDNAKGEVLNTARIAGIMAAKRCAELIPLCHSLPLSFVSIEFTSDNEQHILTIRSTCRTNHQTGVEMEAMTACTVAALTVYDMCKAADKGIIINNAKLVYKSGGKSGPWQND